MTANSSQYSAAPSSNYRPMSKVEGTIKLEQFLKFVGVTDSGGQAKVAIQSGEVTVNGEVESRRGRKLRTGDIVVFRGTHTVPEGI